jgi:Fructose-1,6-bisphosphatase
LVIINRSIQTLEEFRKQELRHLPNSTGELSNLLRDIALAAKRVHVEVNKAGLVDILGETGTVNIQGEVVQRLDKLAHTEFMLVLQRGVSCCGLVSEEATDFISFDEEICNLSKYVVVMDPLDGSSNIDVNISIGTIFGIYRRRSPIGFPCQKEDFLQTGENLVAAGYIIYGSSTMMVYATRRGVNGFTLDSAIGEFTLSHPNMKIPEDGRIYAVNHGNFLNFEKRVQRFIENCQQKANSKEGAFKQRYTGSMVADMHHIILKGGIFLYPGTRENPNGKLRLLYELNPFAFILEIAGGMATNGSQKILQVIPEELHQRSPFFAGSVDLMKAFYANYISKVEILK